MKIFITLIGMICMSLCNYGVQCQQQQQHVFKDTEPSSSKAAYSDQFEPTSAQLGSILLAPQATYQKEAKELKHHQVANKRALYKKMHKLVDELMREDQVERKLEKQLNELDQDKLLILMKKTRPPTSFTAAALQEGGEEEDEERKEKALEIYSGHRQRKSNTLDLLLGALNNSLDGSSAQAAEQQVLNRNLNSAEHARRILDDRFGIMKESKFTTNNHLGLKGVPKFGSDEEY